MTTTVNESAPDVQRVAFSSSLGITTALPAKEGAVPPCASASLLPKMMIGPEPQGGGVQAIAPRFGSVEDDLKALRRAVLHLADSMPECWPWPGVLDTKGYGHFRGGVAHRVIYELLVGESVPDDMQLDHKCNIRHCVNPAHMGIVTPRQNNARSASPSAINSKKTHCDHGHAFDEANTLRRKGYRECRACHNEAKRASRARKKVASLPKNLGNCRATEATA